MKTPSALLWPVSWFEGAAAATMKRIEIELLDGELAGDGLVARKATRELCP